MTKRSVVLLFEQRTMPHLVDGQPPVVPFSHDQPQLHFGHESLRKGFKVYFASSAQIFGNKPNVVEITQIYPLFKTKPKSVLSIKKLSPDFITIALPSIAGKRTLCPKAKFIGFIPSSIPLEAPKLFSSEWIYGHMMAARNYMDFFVTQNGRMADLVSSFFCCFARVDLQERILPAHLGIVKEQRQIFPPLETIRADMGLGPKDVAFINAGGPWRWTDYNTFLRGFCRVVRSGVTNIKFYVMGFKQPGNIDHDEYIAETKAILAENADLIGKNIIVYEDWHKASTKVVQFTHAADVGVNVSKDTAENWQSYRVRFLEYMKAGIPVINTTGDYLSANDAAEAIYLVKAGDIPSYEIAIRDAATNHAKRKQKTEEMRRVAEQFDSRNTYGTLIDKLIEMPKRDFAHPKEWIEPFPFELSSAMERKGGSQWKRLSAAQTKHRPVLKNGRRSLAKDSFVEPNVWQGGSPGANKYNLSGPTKLGTADKIMTIGFTIKTRKTLAPDWAEVLQVGPKRNESRLIVLANSGKRGFVSFSFGFCDRDGQIRSVPCLKAKSTKPVSVIVQAIPVNGLVRVAINGTVYETFLPSWKWLSVDCLWVGSRRLNADVGQVWATSENVTERPSMLKKIKSRKKPKKKARRAGKKK